MSLRVLIADDHSVVLQGIRAFLSLEADMEVLALCTDGLEVLESLDSLEPDVLVMDVSMPRLGGLETHQRIREEGRSIPTVLLTATLSDEILLRCLQGGVDGIVLKDSAAEVLVEAIQAVAKGDRWIPQALTARALELMANSDDDPEGLTPREKEVVLLVAEGAPNKRVASDLGIAVSTVKLHLHNAFNKLGVRNRTQLSLLARERGWL